MLPVTIDVDLCLSQLLVQLKDLLSLSGQLSLAFHQLFAQLEQLGILGATVGQENVELLRLEPVIFLDPDTVIFERLYFGP